MAVGKCSHSQTTMQLYADLMPCTLQWQKFVNRVETVYCAQIHSFLPSCCHHSVTFNLLELRKHSCTFALVVLHNIAINSFAKKSAQLNFTKLIHVCLKSEYFNIWGGDLSVYEAIHDHSDILPFFLQQSNWQRSASVSQSTALLSCFYWQQLLVKTNEFMICNSSYC